MPDNATAAVERKIRQICVRVILSRHAIDRKEVRYFRWYHSTMVVLSSLAGVGLGHPILTLLTNTANEPAKGSFAALTGLTGFALAVGAIAVGILVVLRGLYQRWEVDVTARDALAAYAAFRRILVELRNVLDASDPMPRLLELQERSNALSVHYSAILPDTESVEMRGEATALAQELIDAHRSAWELPALVGGVTA